jgi:hypothetical protein
MTARTYELKRKLDGWVDICYNKREGKSVGRSLAASGPRAVCVFENCEAVSIVPKQ